MNKRRLARLHYNRLKREDYQPSKDGLRAEVWGLWHGYTDSKRGILRRNQIVCATWDELFAKEASQIAGWEATIR